MVPQKKIVLIVEDSEDDFIATARAFNKVGLLNPIRRCSNGDQALDYLYQRGEFSAAGAAPRPGIILLDLNLPGTDGREVLRAIKTDPRLQQIPVIVLSTSNAEQDVADCYKAGANSYVQKPVNLTWLTEVMTRIKEYWLEVSIMPGDLQ